VNASSSPAIRTAKAISRPGAALLVMPEKYQPRPAST
jgi:hypothetical protein